jgi:hypothetical protein
MAEVLGVLARPDATVHALELLKAAGFDDLDAYSPVPSAEIEATLARGPSWVRLWTLVGGLTGATVGYLFTIWSSYDWPLVIGGKPFASVPAYTVIAFELTILLGGLLTLLGMVVHGMIATLGPHTAYRPSFTVDEFGCVVRCHADQIGRVQEILRRAGCTEVRVVEG